MNNCVINGCHFQFTDEFKEFIEKEREMCENNPNMKEANKRIIKILQTKSTMKI